MPASSSVIRTAYDALAAKQSALDAGYQPVKDYPKEYAQLIHAVTSRTCSHTRQSPLVNAGYAARLAVVSSTISSFIKCHERSQQRIQLVILGGGLDIFGLWASSLYPSNIEVFEIDTEEIFWEKQRILTDANLVQVVKTGNAPELSKADEFCASITHQSCATSSGYHLRSCDLRNTNHVKQVLSQLDRSVPTLVLSELVLAYLGRAGVDDLSKVIAELFCTTPTSAFVAFEPLGPPQSKFQNSVIEGYKARYCQQFVEKLERGLAKSSPDDVFHPIGSNAKTVETRFEGYGFGFVKACLAGHAAGCLTTLVSPEPFDEHAALALHLHSYILVVSFNWNVPLYLVRAMCPWSNVAKQEMPSKTTRIKDDSSIVIACIEPCDEQNVQDLFVLTYKDIAKDWKAVRKMVKTAITTDLQVSSLGPRIARTYAMSGGVFLVAVSGTDRTVVGCIGVRSYNSVTPELPNDLISFEVNRLVVAESSRGKGIGKALLQATHESIESEIGLDTPFAVFATTPHILTGANQLYLSFGYRLRTVTKSGGLELNTYVYCK